MQKAPKNNKGIEQLREVMRALRDPQHGCPWDLQQSFTSLIPYTIEETYEAVDAIQKGEPEAMKDELGDLLFQVVFYAQLAEENGWFDLHDIAAGTSNKLIRRHPHVFAEAAEQQQQQPLSNQQIKQQWEAIKQQERQQKSEQASVFDDIPSQLPSVLMAAKLQKRAASVGFDWQDAAPVYDKIFEEIEEVKTARDSAHQEEEVGDLLFAVINLARHLQVNPEAALQTANQKFRRRFSAIERVLAEQQQSPADCDLAQLEEYWQQVKQR
ncbi:nucleoside triphosphate pyrophosphohydrolase [Idiomarina tyrosinivorans]|uniref:nucleoside triphosphate pyrophosphohydrolase n=1 Tax=Idiomarina tyrosinivorans TaxID=1445662 RepID=UPI0023B9275C|nr:nucleoside triphosphate pyrophosphohydrolase [Idiomarina tyrosinivorans]